MVNFALEGLCILICAILFVQAQAVRSKRKLDRWFKLALPANIGLLLGDMSDWGLSGAQFSGAHPLLTAGLTLFYAAGSFVMCSFFVYVFFYMDEKRPQPRALLTAVTVATAAEMLLAFTSPLTGAIFQITAENTYVRGPLFLLGQIPPVCVVGLTLWLTGRTWRLLNRKERVYFGLYSVLPIAAELVQDAFYGLAALPITTTMIFLLVNVFIQSELDEQLRASERQLEQSRIQALEDLHRKQSELTVETITALSNAVEAKDRYTNGHSQRVARYAREIARRMGWSAGDQDRVYYAGLLHDVGKIRVADSIINKNGSLTDEEYAEIKLHTLAGYYILKEVSSVCDFAIGARWHHERYDGKGYPNGLSGENIPLIARIIGVADAYDAMTSNRCYRESMSQAQVRAEIQRGSGTQFDPQIAAIMLAMIDDDAEYQMHQPDPAIERVILAVDDDPMVHKLLRIFLRAEPLYRLESAASGPEGIAFLESHAADLVLLDVEMPGMNGFAVLEWIRKERSDLPVIFMTGDKDIGIIQKAEQLGVSDYITKPLVAHMLMESIQNVLLRYNIREQG